MNTRSWSIVGVTMLVLGAGAYAIGFLQGDDNVRQVGHLLARPDAHVAGTFVLVGVPQPAQVVSGGTAVPNAAHVNSTVHVEAWHLDGRLVHSAHRLRFDGGWFAHTNTSTFAGTNVTAAPTQAASWPAAGTVFPIEGFAAQGATKAWVWAVYDGPLRDPLQPKPSQFKGRLASTAPDGTPLPAGAHVFLVDDITVGCSSKFLPPEYEETSSP